MGKISLLAIVLLSGQLLYLGTGGHIGSDVSFAATATVPLVTVTPRINGCTVHVVGAGQTLWAIAMAYGVKIADIQGLNGMGADNTTIFPGETLVIRCLPLTPTVELRTPATPVPTLRKPSPVRDSPTPALVPTQAGNVPPTSTARAADGSGPPGALVASLVILAGGTLLVVLAFGLVRKR